MYLSSFVATGREIAATAKRTQISFLAASIAYYMFVSLFPLGLLALVVASIIGGDEFALRVVRSLGAVLSPSASVMLRETLVEARGRTGATILGLVILLWSGLRVFRGMDVAFSLVYGHQRVESIIEQLKDALTALAGIGVAILAIAAINVLIIVSGIELAGLLGSLVLPGMLAIAFLPLYYLFPDEKQSLRAVLPGTLFAAVGWSLLGSLFSLYAGYATGFELYGVVGGILLLVTWFYFASIVLLLGAVVNAVLSDSDRHLQQVTGCNMSTMTVDDAADGETQPSADRDAGVSRPTEDVVSGETPPPDDPTARDTPTEDELAELRAELDEFRDDVEDRTLHREDVESDLRRYVRRRVRRGHARGWGPYVVLLYGTVMTLGAFYALSGGWAILAMLVVWLSTLGLYALMLLVGAGLGLSGIPRRLIDRFRE